MANPDLAALTRHWTELDAADIPLEPLEDRIGLDTRKRGAGLTIRGGRDRYQSVIRELKDGRFAYIAPIFIRRNHPGKTIILDSWISPPWFDANVAFVEDPLEGKHPGYYNLPNDTERFPREQVLNHRIICALSRGEIRHGFLLAVGLRPPEEFKNNQQVEVTFGILDQWDCEHTAKIQMRMNRFPARHKEITKSTRGPLLSRRDVIPEPRSWVSPPEPVKESRPIDAETLRRYHEAIGRLHAKSPIAEVPAEEEFV